MPLGVARAVLMRPGAAAADYDAAILALNPIAYWKIDDAAGATLTDETGNHPGTIAGSPERGVETIVQDDAGGVCHALPGTTDVYYDVPHAAALKTAEFTVCVTFQRDNSVSKSILVAADANNAAGGFSVEATSGTDATAANTGRAFLRDAGGVVRVLIGTAGDVALNRAYFMALRGGGAGLNLRLYDDTGALVRDLSNAGVTAGLAGASPIRIGVWHTGLSSPHDGPIARVAWFGTRLGDAALATIAKPRTISRAAG